VSALAVSVWTTLAAPPRFFFFLVNRVLTCVPRSVLATGGENTWDRQSWSKSDRAGRSQINTDSAGLGVHGGGQERPEAPE
jgi:hypothetical protein